MRYDLDQCFRVTMFGKVRKKEGFWYKKRAIPENILLYCFGGRANFEIDGKIFSLAEGDVLTIPAHTPYRPLDAKDFLYDFFHFDASVLPSVESRPIELTVLPHAWLKDGTAYTCHGDYKTTVCIPILTKAVPYEMRETFEKAEKLAPNERASDMLLLDHFARELLIRIDALNFAPKDKRFSKILTYINENFEKKLTLSALSAHFSLSESYISRLFKKKLSLKPSEYINRVRISAAQKMLTESDMSITEIAEKVGFSDVYYFSKVFKKTVLKTPLKVRRGE